MKIADFRQLMLKYCEFLKICIEKWGCICKKCILAENFRKVF